MEDRLKEIIENIESGSINKDNCIIEGVLYKHRKNEHNVLVVPLKLIRDIL